jgi:hypothetical protein
LDDQNKQYRRAQWFQLWLELPIIVIGILFAFAIDAWWEDRNAIAEEQEQLVAIKSGFQTALEEISSDIEISRGLLSEFETLLKIMNEPEITPADIRTATPLIRKLQHIKIYSAPNVDYEDLAASGNLNVLQSAELRGMLLTYQQTHDRLKEGSEVVLLVIIDQGIMPFLAKHAPLELLVHPDDAERIGFTPSNVDAAVESLLLNSEFRNLSYRRLDEGIFAQNVRQEVLEIVKKIIAEIDSQLI